MKHTMKHTRCCAILTGFLVMAAIAFSSVMAVASPTAEEKTGTPTEGKMIGMYVHQHWPYKHPYAARTWTLADWRGYADGLKQLGYNTLLIWPMLEIMPDPSPQATKRL